MRFNGRPLKKWALTFWFSHFSIQAKSCYLNPWRLGGALVGISSIDGFDASENESSTAHFFKPNQWYQCRLRVTDTHFKFWVDGEKLIDCDIDGREISMRALERLNCPPHWVSPPTILLD